NEIKSCPFLMILFVIDMHKYSMTFKLKATMKRIILFAVWIMFVTQALSQITIQGRVKDNKGKPVPGASISIKDTYDGSVVDSTGNYKFSTTEKGDVIFIVTNI